MKESDINSKRYWDNRFDTDWAEASGREQTRFFCDLAVKHLPGWLAAQIREQGLSVCDWGCAEGDGTEILARALAPAPVTGVDFSSAAIRKASENYPGLDFQAVDYLSAEGADQRVFDVVFTSNTLEHFADPFSVLRRLEPRIGRWLVVLIPYREFERIAEHEFTFDFGNTPLTLPGGLRLVHADLVDTSMHNPCYWPGEQMLLVYGRQEQLVGRDFTLADNAFVTQSTYQREEATRKQLASVTAERGELEASLQDKIRAIANLERRLAESDERLGQALALAEQRSRELALVYGSLSWKVTGPLRLVWTPFVKARRTAGRLKRFVASQGGLAQTGRKALAYSQREGVGGLLRQIKRKALPKAALSGARLDREAVVPAPIPPGTGEDVVFWGVIDWHFRFQRPQQLALGFAQRGHRVFYVSAHLLDRAEPGFSLEQIPGHPQVYQVRFHAQGAQPIYGQLPPAEIREQILAGLRAFARWAGAERFISVVQHGFWLDCARSMPRNRLVYDCMDHHEGFGNVSPEILRAEKELVEQCDLLVVTSDWLRDAYQGKNRNVFTVRNACDFEHFSQRPDHVYRDAAGRKIIGYYGAIAEWFDIELVRKVAQSFPDYLVQLIGADTCDAKSQLADLPNVEMVGEVPYAKLPHYLYGFDVCLLPFRVIDLTLATNPVKVYEYLCSGKPVVSVDLPEMRQFGDLVRTAPDHASFVEQCAQALTAVEPAQAVERRIAFASAQTWAHRAAELEASLALADLPMISIIVLTYNNLELTRKCLDSIDRCTKDLRYEIVIVDNASTDGSPEYLRAFAQGRNDVKLVLNTDNKGFAAGNNQGLEVAEGEYLVILNNDTVVTQGWAGALVRHLRGDPRIGLIGPVTNNIGNEAKIQIRYTEPDEMPAPARRYTDAHLGKVFDIRTAAFFCVMLPRSTFQAVGGLDEAFGLGFFEDDDYCRRVEQAGLRCVCAEDVFVHHHLSASFNKLGDQRRKALMEKNQQIYEAKWGKWMPHRYRD
ncbi:hypothetical protein BKK81_16040 [Cupriavidus sp. USMAHM13]|uniref:glycosyltransferase n=1 Tax=Cupriavidus sp. USMAHM13 TaxID=1389192 RepID=UPI0008A693A2|nr:glycosyltransferase [Cupriavidus sp. USMAHM13]AOZ00582.1 hypothetical protein BKK81_16040 [Cupriavidus sp. USMAHM13]